MWKAMCEEYFRLWIVLEWKRKVRAAKRVEREGANNEGGGQAEGKEVNQKWWVANGQAFCFQARLEQRKEGWERRLRIRRPRCKFEVPPSRSGQRDPWDTRQLVRSGSIHLAVGVGVSRVICALFASTLPPLC